jgi:hypothetical protein
MILTSSACCVAYTPLALEEIITTSALQGIPRISKAAERGEGLRESPSWVVDAAEEPNATLVGVGAVR